MPPAWDPRLQRASGRRGVAGRVRALHQAPLRGRWGRLAQPQGVPKEEVDRLTKQRWLGLAGVGGLRLGLGERGQDMNHLKRP